MWPFKEQPKTSLGVDFGVGGLKLVELKNESGRAVLFTYAYTEGGWRGALGEHIGHLIGSVRSTNGQGIEEGILRQIGSAVRQLYDKAGARGRKVIASIPVTAVFNAVVSIPDGDDLKKLKEDAQAEAEKLLPLPVDEMVLDFQKIETRDDGDSKRARILVTAASRILIDEYSRIFKYAGLELVSLETESFAAIRAMLARDKAPAFVIDIGQERTNLFVVNEGVPIIHRSIHMGGQNFNSILQRSFGLDNPQEVEQAKIDASYGLQGMDMPQSFVKIIDPLNQEIKYNLELFRKESRHKSIIPERIVLTGGGALIVGLSRFLENQFNITTYIGDPWARVIYPQPLKPALDAIGPRFGVAVGLAVRNIYGDLA